MTKHFEEMSNISICSRRARWTSSYARCWQSVRRRRLLQEMRKQQQTTIGNIPLRGPKPHQITAEVPNGCGIEIEDGQGCKGGKYPHSLGEAPPPAARHCLRTTGAIRVTVHHGPCC